MPIRSPIGILAMVAALGFICSFLFPGVRLGDVPVSLPSLIALAFLPLAPSAYSPQRYRTVVIAMGTLLTLAALNAVVYGFELRNFLYLFIPLSAIGASVATKRLVERFGMPRIQHWALWLCVINLVVMMAQAINLFEINEHLWPLWSSNIEFVATNEAEREVLALTLPIRPPGLFPTCIYVSTFIYIVCRGIFVYQRRAWPLLLALLAILLTANRTLGLIFVVYESFAFARLMGLRWFALRASLVVVITVATVGAASQAGSDLFLLQFLTKEVTSADLDSNASVVERLKTVQLFLENAPRHVVTGGFLSSELADADHVFDSELMLRLLQFGIVGVSAMAAVIVLPRTGRPDSSWMFLIFLCFVASLTTTLMTSVVYAMAIAFYKESAVRATDRLYPASCRWKFLRAAPRY